MLFARNFGVSSPHDTCGWHSCAECRLKLGCVRVCTHSILFSHTCVYARTCMCVARAQTRAGDSFSFRFPLHVSHRLSRSLSPLSVLRALSGSLALSLAHFFLVSADEDRSLATRREDEEWKMRGVEGEKKRLREIGGEDGRNRKREAPAERARGKPGEPRGSIGGHRPPQKSAHYHPPGYVRRVDGGDDARFINICRRTLNSSLVANENRYRVWSWRSSTRANLTAHYGVP